MAHVQSSAKMYVSLVVNHVCKNVLAQTKRSAKGNAIKFATLHLANCDARRKRRNASIDAEAFAVKLALLVNVL